MDLDTASTARALGIRVQKISATRRSSRRCCRKPGSRSSS
jgi:hypothetical protein